MLPVLGALPDSLIIIASGFGGTPEEAQEQVLIPTNRAMLRPSIACLTTRGWGASRHSG